MKTPKNIVLSDRTAQRLKEILAREDGPSIARGTRGPTRQLIFALVTGPEHATLADCYPCVPTNYVTVDDGWLVYADALVIGANREALVEGKRYLAMRAGDTAGGTAVFVTYSSDGSGGGGGGTITDSLDAQDTVAFSSDITVTTITSNQNNYNPTNLSIATVLRLSSDAAWSITGLSGGADGRLLILTNVGTFAISLPDESGSSTAANRFDTGGQTVTLYEGSSVVLMYDSTASRWRPLATWQGPPVIGTGVSGGQTVTGGTGSGDDLVLQGSSHSTPGTVDVLVSSSDTNSVREAERTRHATSGTPAAGFGVRSTQRLENASGTETDAGSQDVVWTTATGSSEAADLAFRLQRAGTMTEAIRITGTGAIRFPEVSAPGTPASGYVIAYAKSDGLIYSKDDTGTETVVTGGGSGGTFDEGTLAATGSTQGDAAAIATTSVKVSGADGTVGVILPNEAGPILVWNDSMSILKVYPNSGAQISGLGTDNPDSAFGNAGTLYWRAASDKWFEALLG